MERHKQLVAQVEQAHESLSDVERSFVRNLTMPDPRDRLAYWPEVRNAIQDINDSLGYQAAGGRYDGSLVLAINPIRVVDLASKAQENGYQPQADAANVPFSPSNPSHVVSLKEFLQADLRSAQIFTGATERSWILNGRCLALRIAAYRDPVTQSTTWAYAYSENTAPVIHREGDPDPVDVPMGKIVVWTTGEVRRAGARPKNQSWERYLPKANPIGLRAELGRFHDFVRCTNQLELLIRDAEIFGYEVVSRADAETQAFDTLVIKETRRLREPMSLVKIRGGLTEYLEREVESGKPHCRDIMLTDMDEGALNLNVARRVDLREAWQVVDIDGEKKLVTLQRQHNREMSPPPSKGHFRTWGMFGQVDLIRRRKDAIDRLEKHSYLLRSLVV